MALYGATVDEKKSTGGLKPLAVAAMAGLVLFGVVAARRRVKIVRRTLISSLT